MSDTGQVNIVHDVWEFRQNAEHINFFIKSIGAPTMRWSAPVSTNYSPQGLLTCGNDTKYKVIKIRHKIPTLGTCAWSAWGGVILLSFISKRQDIFGTLLSRHSTGLREWNAADAHYFQTEYEASLTWWPPKVSQYQIIKNRIKACQWD